MILFVCNVFTSQVNPEIMNTLRCIENNRQLFSSQRFANNNQKLIKLHKFYNDIVKYIMNKDQITLLDSDAKHANIYEAGKYAYMHAS